MSDRQVRVTFQPRGRVAFALPGTKMIEVAARAGLAIDTPCGGTGTCGKCRVQIVDGTGPPTEADRRVFDGDEPDISSLEKEQADYVKTAKVLMGQSLYSHSWLEL